MFLIFDTETTGLPKNWNAPISDLDNWPRCVQLAWQMHDARGELMEVKNFIIRPDGYTIPYNAEKIHGISTQRALEQGVDLKFVLEEFNKDLERTKFVIGHNVGFDINIMGAEYLRMQVDTPMMDREQIDTKDESTDYCAIPGGRGGKYKWPTLTELHTKLFGEAFDEAHNASADVEATARCFLELVRLGVVTPERIHEEAAFLTAFRESNPQPIELIGLNIEPYQPLDSEKTEQKEEEVVVQQTTSVDKQVLDDSVPFVHLHNHSQFSVLQATSEINALVNIAKEDNMPAVALTDSGNMMAAFHFVRAAMKAEIKPIVGCELYVCDDHQDKSRKNNGHQIVLLAKNKAGYHNLAKLCSAGHTHGFYYVPRVDKKLIEQYKENLICLTGGMRGEVPDLILNVGEEQGEQALLWWKEQFGDDLYVELVRHSLDDENRANEIMLGFARKHDIKVIAANNTFYLTQEDAHSHDILLCVKDGEKLSTEVGRGRGFRYGFPNKEFYFKSQKQMKELFADIPEAIVNIQEVLDKVEAYKLEQDVLLPAFDIPEEFIDPEDAVDGGKRGENKFLRHLTYEGARRRYEEITDDIRERLDFELMIIEKTGYPGYFLIVQDFTTAARDMGVSVGPGRGSAAGSAVAYCIGITNVDPIEYDLLFERFLNPDRVSLPDIDIDFDDEGRGRIIDWVVEKYGQDQVAQIITYGTMAAKSSIRDTARVMELPLSDADRVAKLVPDISLKKLFSFDDEKLRNKLNAEQLEMANQLKGLAGGQDLTAETLNQARILEGSVRNTGIHACGVIITPSDIREHVPVSTAKDSDLYVTQFDNSVVENAGLLKMDFLGLKTLTIIKDAIKIIKERHGVEIISDDIPLDDPKTYELYQRGETNGTFQFESAGMQKHLRALKPDTFADLIAMNALYRPGPLEYIPNFIARKHGSEEITYDIPAMEEYLAETYGITVYQEQVMLLSQSLAGFTKGEADVLRKAMGKKIFALLEQLKPKFLDGCKERGHDVKMAEKVWKDWEAFAAYAFNKSHSTCYSVVAFHTGYLKANYPAEYMASVMTHNMNDIKKITFFMEECKRMGVPVLGPDVNESQYKFTVNEKGEIRFGLGAVKGVGEGAVDTIVQTRKEGRYENVFDLTKRISLRAANKRALENLVLAGALDSFPGHRAMYFFKDHEKAPSFLEKAVKYGQQQQDADGTDQLSLFSAESGVDLPPPTMPKCDTWGTLYELSQEKEVVGIYLSGHPLDDFKLEIENFCQASMADLKDLERLKGKELTIGGIVTESNERISKKGNKFGIVAVEDYTDSHEFFLFGEEYMRYRHLLVENTFVSIRGKVQGRKYNEHELEFSIQQIQLLSELKGQMLKNVNLRVELTDLTEDMLQRLDILTKKYPGDSALNIIVTDQIDRIKLELPSRTRRVEVNKEFMDEVDAMPELTMSLNK